MQFSLHCCCCLPPIVVLCAAQITATASALVVVVYCCCRCCCCLSSLSFAFLHDATICLSIFNYAAAAPSPVCIPLSLSLSLSRLKTYKKLPIPFCSPTSHSHYVSVRHTKHKNVASATKQFIFEAYAGYALPLPCSRSLSLSGRHSVVRNFILIASCVCVCVLLLFLRCVFS